MSNVFKQLEALKGRPETGGLLREQHEANKSRLLLAIGHDFSKAEAVQPVFPSWVLRSFVSKPLAVGVTGVALMTTGWMTTVSAAVDSLPGDRLYSVKLISEKAQLQLASLDRRAVLHTEFAERRLLEVAELRSDAVRSIEEGTSTLVKEALNAYKKEIASAQADLNELRTAENSTDVVQTATKVQQNVTAIEVALDAAAVKPASAEDAAHALEVKEVTREIEETAVDVAVEVHESEQTEVSQQGVSEMFRTQLGTVQSRATVNEHRVEVIQAVMAANKDAFSKELDLPSLEEMKALQHEIVLAMESVPKAMDAFALGAVRNAFDSLSEANTQLLQLEAELAAIELTITDALSAARAAEVRESQEVTGLTGGQQE